MTELPVVISHPDRIQFPLIGLTKLDLAEYYYRMADRILPYIKDRPISIVRCPDGPEHACFFQKHRGPGMPESVERSVKGEKEALLAVASATDLLTLVQYSAIEFHAWGSTFDHLENPDMMVFDLDPGPGIEWKTTIEAAMVLREYLNSLGLPSFAKLSGGKGIHVVVPIKRGSIGWEVKDLAKAIAESFDKLVPGQFVTVMSKAKREKKIFIDYLRNGRGATSVANYTVRSNEDAAVAVPVDWDRLPTVKSPRECTVQNVEEWLKEDKVDPWRDFFKSQVAIKAGIWSQLGATQPTYEFKQSKA